MKPAAKMDGKNYPRGVTLFTEKSEKSIEYRSLTPSKVVQGRNSSGNPAPEFKYGELIISGAFFPY